MPTTRARHTLTETDRIAAGLALAAMRWPEDRDRPGKLLQRILEIGMASLENEHEAKVQRRLAAVRRPKDALAGTWQPGDLERLRQEWPE